MKLTKTWNSFSETAQKLKLQNADYQLYFQNKNKKSCTYWWNYPAFGIEKNGPTYAEFEAWRKLHLSSFKIKKIPAFLKNGRHFWDKKKIFGSLHFFFPKSQKKSIFWYSISVKKIRFRGGISILNYFVETICSFRPVSIKRPVFVGRI